MYEKRDFGTGRRSASVTRRVLFSLVFRLLALLCTTTADANDDYTRGGVSNRPSRSSAGAGQCIFGTIADGAARSAK
jgi:hypothetical protein